MFDKIKSILSQQATYFFFQTFHKASFVLLDTELIQLATLYSNKAIKSSASYLAAHLRVDRVPAVQTRALITRDCR